MQEIAAVLTAFPAGMYVEQEIVMWEVAFLLWSLGHIGLESKKKQGNIN